TRLALHSTASPGGSALVRGAFGVGSMVIAAFPVASPLCFAFWPPERLRLTRSRRPPIPPPPGPTAAPNLSRPLPSSSRRRQHRPPGRAPKQLSSRTRVSPSPSGFSRLLRGIAVGHAATLGALVFIFVPTQSLERGRIVNSIVFWLTWRLPREQPAALSPG